MRDVRELLAAIPELAAYERTATRLHPRPGEVSAADSHVGGPLRWPAGEPWPTCDAPVFAMQDVPLPGDLVRRLRDAERQRVQRHVMTEEEVALHREIAAVVGPGYSGFGSVGGGPVVGRRFGERPHPRPNPLIPVAQLRAADIPDLPRPGGADLLQVLWCPHLHAAGPTGPTVHLRWRCEADLTGPFAEPPDGEPADDDLVPVPCRLHPQRVVEYPFPQELPDTIRSRVGAGYPGLALAPGWKVGGHADWSLTDLGETPCPRCAGPTDLLLVVDSKEYDGGTPDRWRLADDPDPDEAREPTGVVVGRHGALRVFVCLRCPDTPSLLDQQ
ncbi:hypothetical protein GCM10010399_65190 [Dactylosporangium fulvum]|uniref:LigA protein n=1 Tax=Dactylosporangium fulvum TaxID=53359 RepID=A0ABY5VP27_9ACTN|nr:hypothetical protein [Dactylosporangium fulvum]UWP78864.1 hypothetical protein Dfulv_27240 [Dactylosporangium fulvum]